MKNYIKPLFNIFIIVGLSLLVGSCGSDESVSITNTSDLSSFLTKHNFYLESSLNESQTYSFDGSSFKLSLKDKRSGSERSFDGSYETKSSKYSDKGTEFFYVKLVFNDKSYSDESFFVFHDGNLVEPSNNGVLDKNEDEYGLNIPEWHVTLSPDYNKYSPIDK
jgi:hypothetical protein